MRSLFRFRGNKGKNAIHFSVGAKFVQKEQILHFPVAQTTDTQHRRIRKQNMFFPLDYTHRANSQFASSNSAATLILQTGVTRECFHTTRKSKE